MKKIIDILIKDWLIFLNGFLVSLGIFSDYSISIKFIILILCGITFLLHGRDQYKRGKKEAKDQIKKTIDQLDKCEYIDREGHVLSNNKEYMNLKNMKY